MSAVVYDRPQLLFYLNEHPHEDLHIATAEYFKQGYGFAFKQSEPLIFDVNRTLLQMAEENNIQEILDQYIGPDK